MDHDPKEEREQKSFQITHAGGIRSYMTVGYAFGDSTEFLIHETYVKLENVREATVGGWVPQCRFDEMGYVLKGDAFEAFDEVARRDYPNPVDKTNVNFEEL